MAISLKSFWHPIARSEEVSDKPKSFTLLGEKLVAFRSGGDVAVFTDLCIHRGAALSGGTVKDGNIVCPYHGWAYDKSGTCVHIPSLPPGMPIPAKAKALPQLAREAYGLIWVCLEAPAQSFPAWPDDAWDSDKYRVAFVKAYDWKTSAGRVVENAMDFSHFNIVHVGFTELADGPIVKPYEVERTETGLKYEYDDGHLLRQYTVDVPFIVHDRKSVVNVGGGATWSDSAESKAGDVTILTFIAAPVQDKETRIYVYVSRNHSLDKDDAEFTGGFDAVMDQDRVIVETQRPEQIPVDVKEELHLRVPDAAGLLYRRSLRELDKAEAFALP
ncbi:MAG: aromatic ring-hydroxylating dioxygenase subunit alpha [Afipia felis]|nr:aromatic ring-hydroxylating dioxygenase subunit alpha [Afipia felis]